MDETTGGRMRLVKKDGWILTDLGRVDVMWCEGMPLAFRDDRLQRVVRVEGNFQRPKTQLIRNFFGTLDYLRAEIMPRREFEAALLASTALSDTGKGT